MPWPSTGTRSPDGRAVVRNPVGAGMPIRLGRDPRVGKLRLARRPERPEGSSHERILRAQPTAAHHTSVVCG